MNTTATRRRFLQSSGAALLGSPALSLAKEGKGDQLYTIGLSQYSLHRMIRDKKLDPLDYPRFAKEEFGIEMIDIFDGALPPVEKREPYLEKMRSRSKAAGTDIFLMMVDPLRMTSDEASARQAEVKRMHRLVDQASLVGARYLRIFLDAGAGTKERQAARSIDGLKRLSDYSASRKVTIAIEPGISISSKGSWLAGVIKKVASKHCAAMPDFGKFGKYDKYEGTRALMPVTAVVSAKSHGFGADGLEEATDYPRIMKIVVDSGFRGIVAIEYEGSKHPELEGVKFTKQLLEKIRAELS